MNLEINYRLNDVENVAKQLINNLTSKIILMNGEMGVGKTTLIKAIVKELGSTDVVSSPTFSIVNEYEINNNIIYHFDLYRIKDLEEAYNFGIEDYLYNNNWVIIEWPEIIESILPDNYNVISLVISTTNDRILKFNKTYNPNNSNKLA